MAGLYWIILFSFLITLLYAGIIYWFHSGWINIKVFSPPNTCPEIFVSIVIPFRNESAKIKRNIISLINQDYPASQFEVIYVDDHSEDNSAEILQNHMRDLTNFRIAGLDETKSGKKAALVEGAKSAKADLLLFTDADSYPVQSWVRTMAMYYEKHNPVMISGPVIINESGGILKRFQTLEFMSLTGSAAGSFGVGNPVLCNGANLGYDRKVYLQNTDNLQTNILSGDDIFMMLSLKNNDRSRLQFVKSPDAIVFTDPVESVRQFFMQRMRWASKARYYKDFHILLTAFAVFAINVLMVGLIIGSLFYNKLIWIFLSVLICLFFFQKREIIKFIDSIRDFLYYIFCFFGNCRNYYISGLEREKSKIWQACRLTIQS